QRPTPCLRALPPMTAQIATALGPTLDEPGALQLSSTVHVSEGSIATDEVEVTRSRMSASPLKADNLHTISASPLSAKSGHCAPRGTQGSRLLLRLIAPT